MTKIHRPWYSVLYIQVLIAIAIGIFIGHFWPIWERLLNLSGTASSHLSR